MIDVTFDIIESETDEQRRESAAESSEAVVNILTISEIQDLYGD